MPTNMPAATREFLTPREREQYSVRRFILSQAEGQSCFEREVAATVAKVFGSGRGELMPPEIFWGPGPQERALTAGTAGSTIGNEVAPLIEYLYPQSVTAQLGVGFISGQRGAISIPRISGSDEAEWLTETGSPTPGAHDTTLGQIALQAKRLFSETDATKQFMVQCSASEAMLRSLIMGKVAAGFDRAILVGAGAAQPIGILNDANSVTASSGNDGAAPTITILNATEHEVISANVKPKAGASGWVVSAAARRKLKGTAKISGGSECLCQTGDDGVDRINGYKGFATTLLPDNLTKGSGSSLGSAIFGADWASIVVTVFGGIDLLVDPYSLATSGQLSITTNVYADIAKRRPEAFAKLKDIVTA